MVREVVRDIALYEELLEQQSKRLATEEELLRSNSLLAALSLLEQHHGVLNTIFEDRSERHLLSSTGTAHTNQWGYKI
jgi:hypothetical protein